MNYNPRNIRDVMRGEYGPRGILNNRFNNRVSIDDQYSGVESGFAGGTGYRSVDRNHAAENTDYFNSQGSVTPVISDVAPAETTADYGPMADYSALSRASRVESQDAREIADAIAEARRPQDTEILISDNLQDNTQDNQDTYSELFQGQDRYDWFDEYNALLNESENVTDTQDIDSGLESLLDTETDRHDADMQNPDAEAEELEHDVEQFQH